jgi:hypothetical protein
MTRGGHWSGDGSHVVDGYWMGAEVSCDPASADECGAAIRAAETALGVDPNTVVKSSVAFPPSWVRGNGEIVLGTVTGPWQPRFAIIDLAAGPRRVVGFTCRGAGSNSPDGTVASRTSCKPIALDEYRVGSSPGD